jgi:peptidoglycan hydrolase CwlO-like protein
MDTNTIVITVSVTAAIVTMLVAWFTLAKGSKAQDVRIQAIEKTLDELKSACMEFSSRESVDRWVEEIKEKLDDCAEEVDRLNTCFSGHDRDIVRVQEIAKFIETYQSRLSEIEALRAEFLEKFIRRGDFIREMQILNSQVAAIYQKIDHVDEKVDERLRVHR